MANDDDSFSSSSTLSSTVTQFYGFGGNVVVRLFDRSTGIERANIIDLISDNKNNDNRNDIDNDTHQSVISISSSTSSSSVQIVEDPVYSVPFVSPDTKPIYDNLSGWPTVDDSKFSSTMVKSKKTQPTDEEAFQAIESSDAPLPARQRKKPSQFCPSNGNNDNNDNNNNKKPKAKVVKKKKTLSSTLSAISKSVTNKKVPTPLRLCVQ